MFFLLVESLPVFEVLGEVDFVGRPERGQVALVHFVDGVVLDGEQHEALRVLAEDGLGLLSGGERRCHLSK